MPGSANTGCLGGVDAPRIGSCGGISGPSSPTGLQCLDDPRDTCDPHNGSADCPGIYVQPPDITPVAE